MPRVRRVLLALLIIFVIYAVLNSPRQSANMTGDAWDQIKSGISAIGTFFDTLIAS